MFDYFFKSEAAGGVLLLLVTVLAMGIANSPFAPLYFGALHVVFGGMDILHWINEGLMALFFLMVGLEIRREINTGELRSWRRRALPGIAALGGMVAPALIYVAINRHDPVALGGWAIPTATDIAFSLGVLILFGPRVPPALKVFLTALAIMDDLFAVLIIALFYGHGLSPVFAGLAGLAAAAIWLMGRMRVAALWPYLLLGLGLWFCILESGLHATLAGVVLAFVMPPQTLPSSPTPRLEHGLVDWVAFAILPLFAFANAGVSLAGLPVGVLLQPVTLGVTLGLFVGKQIGVFGAVWAGVRLGLGQLPEGMGWREVYGVSLLCGIGFTISLFIGALAFEEGAIEDATKLGVLLGSLLSAVAGVLVLAFSLRRRYGQGEQA